MEEIHIKTDYITLGQFLKLANLVDSGVMSKLVILDGLVKVNNEVETRRGKKLYNDYIVSYDGQDYIVKSDN